MDISKIISDLVGKLTGKKDLIAKFLANPADAIKELLGIDVDAADISKIVDGVKEKLGGDAGEAVKEGKNFIQKILGLFKKK